jgi:hypothetical protein
MKLPETPGRGSPLDATWGRQVVDYLRALTPRGPSVGTTAGGTTITGGKGGRTKPQRAYTPRTFFTTAADDGVATKVSVSAGAINSIVSPKTELSVISGDKIYIDATVDEDGFATAVVVANGSDVPENTSTHGYTILATVAVVSGSTVVTPLAWNYSQLQTCGPLVYLWGGFGE